MKANAARHRDRAPRRFAAAALALGAAACGGGGDATPAPTPAPPPAVVAFDFNLATDAAAWTTGFADYSPTMERSLNTVAGPAALPAPLAGLGLRLGADNRSDDLFMFAKRRTTGLAAGRSYTVATEVAFATNASTGCSGVGGPPGEGVWVKAGATTTEPQVALVGSQYQIDIDKGIQATGGTQAALLGDIANGDTDCNNPVYRLKSLSSPSANPIVVTADAQGGAWLMVGTDSGYEGRTDLYYTRVRATFTLR